VRPDLRVVQVNILLRTGWREELPEKQSRKSWRRFPRAVTVQVDDLSTAEIDLVRKLAQMATRSSSTASSESPRTKARCLTSSRTALLKDLEGMRSRLCSPLSAVLRLTQMPELPSYIVPTTLESLAESAAIRVTGEIRIQG
jgi:hypothetical protein